MFSGEAQGEARGHIVKVLSGRRMRHREPGCSRDPETPSSPQLGFWWAGLAHDRFSEMKIDLS